MDRFTVSPWGTLHGPVIVPVSFIPRRRGRGENHSPHLAWDLRVGIERNVAILEIEYIDKIGGYFISFDTRERGGILSFSSV